MTIRRVVAAALLLLAGGCTAEAGPFRPELDLEIVAPDAEADLRAPFTLEMETDAPLGCGEHLIGVFVDGLEVGETRDGSFRIETLTRGVHGIHVSLLNPDGSPAGGEDELTVQATGGAGIVPLGADTDRSGDGSPACP